MYADVLPPEKLNTFIVVKTDTIAEAEIERYLEIPFSNENYATANGLRFNPILVSKDDVYNLTFSLRAESDSNFAFGFAYQILLAGLSGQNYRAEPDIRGISVYTTWEPTTQTPDNFTTGYLQLSACHRLPCISVPLCLVLRWLLHHQHLNQ